MDNAVTHRMEPQTDFIYCSGAITEVLKCGSCQLHSGHKVLFLIIPGNPGVVGFYRTFIQTLHSMFGYHYPVWAVSHAGHCVPPDSMDMVEDVSLAAEQDVFGLNGQIEHKLAFLRRHVPRETSLVLVGHSIGCYIILDIMKRNPVLKIIKAIMLFPTIERMAESPQGKVMTPVLCHMRYVAYLPLFLLSLLPEGLKASLIKLVFGSIRSLDHTVVQPTVGLLSGDCAVNAMYMGGQEMRKVLRRDNITIKKNLEKTTLLPESMLRMPMGLNLELTPDIWVHGVHEGLYDSVVGGSAGKSHTPSQQCSSGWGGNLDSMLALDICNLINSS